MFKLFEREKREEEQPGVQGLELVGNVTIKLYDGSGNLKAIRGPMRNTITQIGRSYILMQLGSAITSGKTKKGARWTGIGHSSTAASTTQTALISQRARRKNYFTFASGHNYSSNIATFVTFGPGGSFSGKRKATIYESALFWASQSTANTCLARQAFSAVTKLSADTLTVEWKVSMS